MGRFGVPKKVKAHFPFFFFFFFYTGDPSQDKHDFTVSNFQTGLSPYKRPSFLWPMFAQKGGPI